MKKLSLIIIFLSSLLYSCIKDRIVIDPNNPLIGIWNYSDYKDNADVYTRSREFSNKHCYKFNSDGTLIERNISGFCATPPVSYSDYSGSWTILCDTIIQINVTYFDGPRSYKLNIESLNANSLKVIQI